MKILHNLLLSLPAQWWIMIMIIMIMMIMIMMTTIHNDAAYISISCLYHWAALYVYNPFVSSCSSYECGDACNTITSSW